jgi:ammonium transporter, Amt family
MWAVIEATRLQKSTMLGASSGLVAGLGAVTPAAGFVTPIGALAIGGIAGVVCFGGVMLKQRLGYDDALDAFGVHGVGGAAGAILTGVFATAALAPGGEGGGLRLVGIQLLGVGAAAAYAAIVTLGILVLVKRTVGLRVDAEVEYEGLDGALHGESGYAIGGGGGALTGGTPTVERSPLGGARELQTDP